MVMPTFLMPWLPSLVRRRIAILQKSCLRKESWVQIPLTASHTLKIYLYESRIFIMSEFSSILTIIGYSLVGGIASAYLFKRVAKILVVLIGIIFFIIPVSGYADTLPVFNYIAEYIFGQTVTLTTSVWTMILLQLEMAVPFVIGFIIGIKKF